MVRIVEITGRASLEADPAWARLQDDKRRASIRYYLGYPCTCGHEADQHGKDGCRATGCKCGHKD